MGDPTATWQQGVEYEPLSDVGMRRANNQDALACELAADEDTWRRRGHVFIVADGMGAHAAGERASELAVETIPHLYRKYREQSAPEALRRAVVEANTRIHECGQANEDFHNMGTTCSVLTLLPQGAVIAHVGDSRVYRLRGSQLEQLTFDHSLVWEMRAAGQLPDDADFASLIPKNVITRSLGPNAAVKVDIEGPFPIEVGDVFLLCSDGLTGPVSDDEIGPILANLPPKDAGRFLIELANLRGGPDNITLIIAKVVSPAIRTEVGETQSITFGGEKKAPSAPMLLWVLMAACFLLAIIMALSQNFIVATVAACAGVVCLTTILLLIYRESSAGVVLGAGQRFGHGPHTSIDGRATPRIVDKLADVMQQLREAIQEHKWDVDWIQIDGFDGRATKAAVAANYSLAVQEYARGISFMMKEIRVQRQKQASDSSIDLV